MRLLGYVWSLLNSLIGLALVAFSKPSDWFWMDALYVRVEKFPLQAGLLIKARTMGAVIAYRGPLEARTIKHESVHVTQGLWLGPFFLLAYPIASLVAMAQGKHFYWGNYFERKAYAAENDSKG